MKELGAAGVRKARAKITFAATVITLLLVGLWLWAEQNSPEMAIFFRRNWIFYGLIGIPFCYGLVRGRSDRDDRAVFALELADLLEMGVPLAEALQHLHAHSRAHFKTAYARLPSALEGLAEGVSHGSSLVGAMARTNYFPSIWIQLLEETQPEQMVSTLRILARVESQDLGVKPLATAYLATVFVMMMGIMIFYRNYIAPTFTQLLEGAQAHSDYYQLGWVGAYVGLFLAAVAGILILAYFEDGPWNTWLAGWGRPARDRRLFRSLVAAQAGLASQLSGSRLTTLAMNCGQVTHRARWKSSSYEDLPELYRTEPLLQDEQLAWLIEQGQRLGNLDEVLEVTAEQLRATYELQSHRAQVRAGVAILACFGLAVGSLGVATFGVLVDIYQLAASEVFLP
ncbi:MAG: type II secretion system F family protein [Vulcanimicrobiota bacterium]